MGQKRGNPIPSFQNQGYEALWSNSGARENRDMGTKPVMIDDQTTLDAVVDSGSLKYTKGYAKDTDLTDGSINASFDTITANEYYVTVYSSSVLFSTGSTLFGNSNDDTHTFTGSLNVSGSINGVQAINFDTAHSTQANIEGRLTWNTEDGTLNLGLKGGNATLQVGQEEVVRVVNKTGANLLQSTYKAVRVRTKAEGGAQGQRLAVVNGLATGGDINSATTLGIVTENININQEGFITVFGFVRDINTTGALQGESWEDGDILYLSTTVSGALTNVKPVAPAHTVIMGYVAYSHSNQGKIFVKVDNGYELDELHNVYINDSTLTGNVSTGGSSLYYSGSVWTNNQNTRLTQTTAILASVSSSLNFANDTLAAAGGVPLGGLYRNGNVIQIRLV
jgi:hypothetical protein